MLEIWKLTVARKKKTYPQTTKPVSSVGGYQAFLCRDASLTHKRSCLPALMSGDQLKPHLFTPCSISFFTMAANLLCGSQDAAATAGLNVDVC